MLNETKLNNFIHPNSSISHKFYNLLRRDRVSLNSGGGVLVYIKKEYIIKKSILIHNFEAIYFQLKFDKKLFNFISCYRPPSTSSINNVNNFLELLENFLFSLDPSIPLFIIGDFNINYSSANFPSSFFNSYNLSNYINMPTRYTKKNYNNSSKLGSYTVIDLVLHNFHYIDDCRSIICPFSDHNFVLVSLKKKNQKKSLMNLSI